MARDQKSLDRLIQLLLVGCSSGYEILHRYVLCILIFNFVVKLSYKTMGKQMFDVESIESDGSRTKRSHVPHPGHQEHALSSTCPQDEEDDDGND